MKRPSSVAHLKTNIGKNSLGFQEPLFFVPCLAVHLKVEVEETTDAHNEAHGVPSQKRRALHVR